MKLENELVVPASVDDAWSVLLDVERVAPCLPGAAIEGSDGDAWRGTMTVKIGPITARYKGTLKIEEADEEAHRAVLKAQARDARGQGGASATITSTMQPGDEGTRVRVETDLRVTGAAAQFGRGVMQDVSAQMMSRFADCLAAEMGRQGAPAPEPAAAGATTPEQLPAAAGAADRGNGAPAEAGPEPAGAGDVAAEEASAAVERATPDVLDLGELGRGVLVKRALPVAGALAAAVALLFLIRRLGSVRR